MATINRIWVRKKPGRAKHLGIMRFNAHHYTCTLGRSGIGGRKKEGDGKTPCGVFRSMRLFYRKDRIIRRNWSLPNAPISEKDGWCDDPNDQNYNKLIRLPYKTNHELLHRQDQLYDVCVVLDYNISNRSKNRGSAIFFHLQDFEQGPTQGCIALSLQDMQRVLNRIGPKTVLDVAI